MGFIGDCGVGADSSAGVEARLSADGASLYLKIEQASDWPSPSNTDYL
jgi:hypothetical protein